MRQGPDHSDFQSGVALAIVVWFIAGMSLLVAGIVSHARVDVQLAQVHADRARVIAAGDGATRLLIGELASADRENRRPASYRYRVGEQEVRLEIVRTSGLIDLNRAKVPVLKALFSVAAGLPPADAQRLARSVDQWRLSRRGLRGPRNRFDAMEDLLRVPGIDRALFDAVRDHVVAGDAASGESNARHSTNAVRSILKAAGRAAPAPRGAGGDEEIASGSNLRVDAIIDTGGRTWLRRQWLASGSNNNTFLPWHAVRIEPPRVVELGRG